MESSSEGTDQAASQTRRDYSNRERRHELEVRSTGRGETRINERQERNKEEEKT